VTCPAYKGRGGSIGAASGKEGRVGCGFRRCHLSLAGDGKVSSEVTLLVVALKDASPRRVKVNYRNEPPSGGGEKWPLSTRVWATRSSRDCGVALSQRPGTRRSLDAAEAPPFMFRRNTVRRREAGAMANLELWLSSGEKLQIRVDNVETELAALKNGNGRFSGDFVDLTGPALGIVRTDAIVAVVIR
jgi:hypothetical protein